MLDKHLLKTKIFFIIIWLCVLFDSGHRHHLFYYRIPV